VGNAKDRVGGIDGVHYAPGSHYSYIIFLSKLAKKDRKEKQKNIIQVKYEV
jgi:hypothetical protein